MTSLEAWRERARSWVQHLPLGTVFTADDLVEDVGVPDPSHAANSTSSAVGSLFTAMAQAGLIETDGRVVKSRQKHRKGGAVRVWKRVRPAWEEEPVPTGPAPKVMKRRSKPA